MARDPERKNQPKQRQGTAAPDPNGAEGDTAAGRIPELLRRGLTLGFSGLFMTEEAVRRAFGDTVPRDWVDFATEQSARTRSEFLERLSGEIARSLEAIDLVEILDALLSGRTLEVRAEVRLRDRNDRHRADRDDDQDRDDRDGDDRDALRLSLFDRGRRPE